MTIRKLAAVTAILLATAGAAHATTFDTVTDSYTVSLSSFTGNKPTITNILGNTLNLTPSVPSASTNFFTATPASRSGLMGIDPTVIGTITVTMNFTFGGMTGSITETGTYEAKYGGSPLPSCTNSGAGDTDCIVWHGASNTPNGSVTIPVTSTNGLLLDVTFYNANDWSITPKISFDLDPATTPIPAALPLFAGGLGLMGFFAKRRKQKSTSLN